MKKDVVQNAFESTVAYVKQLNSSSYFYDIIDSYLRRYSKWCDIQETTVNNYVKRYNLPSMSLHNYSSPDKSLYSVIERKIKLSNDNLKILEEREKVWDSAKHGFSTVLNETISDTPFKSVNNLDDLSKEIILFTETQLTDAQKYIREHKKKIREHIVTLAKKVRKDELNTELKDYEKNIVSIVFKHYVNTLTNSLKSLFETDKVYVKVNMESFYKEIKDKYQSFSYYSEEDNSLSVFEQYVLGFVKRFKRHIEIIIHKNEKTMTLNIERNAFSFKDYDRQPKVNKKKLASYEKELDKFYNQYPAFKALNSLKNHLKRPKLSMPMSSEELKPIDDFITQVIFHYYERPIIERYNGIVNDLQSETSKTPSWEDRIGTVGEEAVKFIQNSFVNLKFETEQVQNLGYKIALNKEVYDTKVTSISNENMILDFTR